MKLLYAAALNTTYEQTDTPTDGLADTDERTLDDLTDEERQEAIYKFLTHPINYVLWGIFILIFIGIYCVCRESKKSKKGKTKKKMVRQPRRRRQQKNKDQVKVDVEHAAIFSEKMGAPSNS